MSTEQNFVELAQECFARARQRYADLAETQNKAFARHLLEKKIATSEGYPIEGNRIEIPLSGGDFAVLGLSSMKVVSAEGSEYVPGTKYLIRKFQDFINPM